MNTARSVPLLVSLIALAACAGGVGVDDGPPVNEAAVANMNLGAGYLQQGRTDLAIERLQRALAQDPRLVLAHTTIAVAYDQIGSLEEAEMHYRRATELDPDSAGAANAYAAFLCNRQNRWADAEPYFRRAAANPTYATPEVPLTNAGLCARAAGQNEAAANNFRAALARNPSYPDALLNMMELSYQDQNYMQTRAFVQRYLDTRPPTAAVLLMCFNTERELNNAQAAEGCAAQLRSGFQGSPELEQLEQQRTNGR
jgi:type IV pilus assembly protein PilF